MYKFNINFETCKHNIFQVIKRKAFYAGRIKKGR